MTLPVRILILLALAAPVAAAQEQVTAAADDSSPPVLRFDRFPTADADLLPLTRRFNGQHSLDRLHAPGLVDVTLPASLGWQGIGQPFVAEGVVLRSDAYLTPDRSGALTVLTVLPSTILQMPDGYPSRYLNPRAQRAPARRGTGSSANVNPGMPTTLRFVMAGGTIYVNDNDGMAVQQAGVTYPSAGNTLIFFGETVPPEASAPGSTALILTGACALQGSTCVSIDGSSITSDALTSRIPGGLAAAQAYSMAGAPVANTSSTGVRGLAATVESHYSLGLGDLRSQDGPDIPVVTPFAPATASETLVRAHVLTVDATLTANATGLISRATIAVDRVLVAPVGPPREPTMEVTERGGFLRMSDDVVLPTFTSAQMPLVVGGDYFLALGLTGDNRWEVRGAWRIIGDEVFSMDRARNQLYAREPGGYWRSVASFMAAFKR